MLYRPLKARLLLAALAVYVFSLAYSFFSQTGTPVSFYRLGQFSALLALSLLPLQYWLSARFRPLEAGIGLDRLIRWHRRLSQLILLLIILHPLLLSHPRFLSWLTPANFLIHVTAYNTGLTALFLLLFIIITAVYTSSLNINYEIWKQFHRVVYLFLALVFFHSYRFGSHIASGPFHLWFFFLLFLSLAAVVHRYIFRQFNTGRYQIIRLKKESPDVISIFLSPLEGKIFNYVPGQFAFITFKSGRLPAEEHHFTLSSSPGDPHLSFTIKASGDFTSKLSRLRPGDTAIIDGPYGVFSPSGSGPFIFIAGGIGITPFYSIIRHFSRLSPRLRPKCFLIYSAAFPDDLIFIDQLNKFAKQGWLKVFPHLSSRSGHLSRSALSRFIPPVPVPTVFLVGPKSMVRDLTAHLSQILPASPVYTESFDLKV